LPKQPTEIDIEISTLSEQGSGGGTHNERPVWVRNALPGETVRARILKRRGGQRFADGQPLENFSSDRVTSPCQYFPRCGGCATHHMAPTAQLGHKQRQLSDQLVIQGIQPNSWRVPVALLRLGYRRKARMGVRVVGESVLVGFRESFSNRVARIDACLTLTPELSKLIPPLKASIAKMSDPKTIPQIELAQGDSGCAVIVRHLQPLTDADVALWQAFEVNCQVEVLMQSKGYDTLTPIAKNRQQMSLLHYQIPEYGLTIGFYPHYFTQVNAPMNRELVRTVMGYLGNVRGHVVVDMFCGIGNFTLPLARAGALAVGIEASDEAVEMAKENARVNRVDHASAFYAEDLYGEGGALVSATDESDETAPTGSSINACFDHFSQSPDALILDPPRSGAGPNLEGWAGIPSLKQIVYVSCNPVTFAEDAKRLKAKGYVLEQVGVYDMFPGTAHVETVGRFVRTSVVGLD
jgi:23S rRNA (uracil1939-C5)-methyltransferase